MYSFNLELKSKDRHKLVYEDLSPILKENSDRFRDVNNETVDLISQLNSVKIDMDKKARTGTVNINVENEKINCKKKNSNLSQRNQRRPQKENVGAVTDEAEKFDERKVNRTKGTKKKDSFIVSDSSPISNDSMTIYHRVLSERIRVDVRKITPRSRLRKSISTNDDGIFTPYVFGKRSCSESSLSDNENEINDISAKLKLPKTEVRPSSNLKLKDRTRALSDDNSRRRDADFKNDSSDLFSLEPKKRNRPLRTRPALPSVIPRNFLKDYSWIFSDDESSNSEKKISTSEKSSSPDLKPVTPLDVKLPLKDQNSEKVLVTPLDVKLPLKDQKSEKVLVTPTPITFRLKQVKNLTPKLNAYKEGEPLSFLKSLSTFTSPRALHPDAEPYKKKFKKLKEELALRLFKIFNEKVFDKQLPSDMKIEWSGRLRSSSGLCYNKRIKNVVGPNNGCLRTSRIALSIKIIETPDRLRDTLIHEMCHAAAWIIDNKCDGHGQHWRAWAAKAMKSFPELPSIRRCHDYSINTKFKYKCVKCGYTIGRHSKSLNLERKRCGYCYGQFELVLSHENVAKSNPKGTKMSPKNMNTKPLTKFALFVKDNYGKVKSEKPNLKHGEIMKELGKNFASTKSTN